MLIAAEVKREFFSSDERLITIDGWSVTLPSRRGGKPVKRRFDFRFHPLRDVVVTYLKDSLDQWAAGTATMCAEKLAVLGEFMREHSVSDLTPDVFGAYLTWIGAVRNPGGGLRFGGSSIDGLAIVAIRLYEFGASHGYRNWSVRHLDLMRACRSAKMRGSYSRARRSASLRAMASDEVLGLLRAARLELEECERIAAARQPAETMHFGGAHPKRRRDLTIKRQGPSLWPSPKYPNPYVPFAILLALRQGLRSAEFNEMQVDDLQVIAETAGELFVHAPNKESAVLRLDAATLAAWRLCMVWSESARSRSKWPSRMLHWWGWAGRSNWIGTRSLNVSLLPAFYAKYFTRTVQEGNGLSPILHAHADRAGDPAIPFRRAYNVFRTAAAVMFASKERNLALTQRFLRHRRSATTEIYYLPKRAEEHAIAVGMALKAAAQLIGMGLKNPVVATLTTELVTIESNGGKTPFGTCGDPAVVSAKGSASRTAGCVRARDCLECEFLYLHAHKRPLLVEDRDRLLSLAEARQKEGYLRDAENLRSGAALREANINRIDELIGGTREHASS